MFLLGRGRSAGREQLRANDYEHGHHTKNFPPCLSARQHTENLTNNKEQVLQKLRIIDIRNKGLPEERNLISQSS